MKVSIITGLLAAAIFAALGVVQIERATVRTGPGAFFPIVAELAQGAEIAIESQDDGWAKISAGDINGYVSSRAFQTRSAARTETPRLQARQVDMTVSSTGVSAAVRGFSTQYAQAMNIDSGLLDQVTRYTFSPERFQQFHAETYRETRPVTYRRQHRLPRIRHEMLFYPVDEEGAGFALAAGLARGGLLNQPQVIEYVRFVGQHIVDVSHAYDLGFRFFVTASEQMEAYSTPGGFVFISVGTLRQLRNEAELAAILAHEMTHIILRHGLTELDIRQPRINSQSAFDELAAQMQRTDEESRVVSELNQQFLDYEQRLYAPRTEIYEHESDELALLYLARAGYSPQALHNVILKLLNNADRSFEKPYILGELEMRNAALMRSTESRNWGRNYFFNTERYDRVRAWLP
jgi:uncharacterized protein YraI